MIEFKTLQNANGEKIFVETHTPKNVERTIVFCHGITGCRKGRTPADSYFQDLAKRLSNLNFKVVLFDYSGHGDSEGRDMDVCPSKNASELAMVFDAEVVDKTKVDFLVFSYGATVLCEFLQTRQDIKPGKIVMYSPCIYPNRSCLLNPNSAFGKDVVGPFENGSLMRDGFAVVGAKGFKVGAKLIEECEKATPDYLANFAKQTLVLSGDADVILNTEIHTAFCEKHGIKNVWLSGSHSLFESIEKAFELTVEHFKN